MGVKVWYLFHSGFALKVNNTMLIFDYYKDRPLLRKSGLEGGVIDPKEIAAHKVYVFSSHSHYDHYNPVIMKWKKTIPDINYIFSDDIQEAPFDCATFVSAHNSYDFGDIAVDTLESNDQGVAFLVSIAGIKVFHAGDLNWWKWDSEGDKWNRDIEEMFKNEISKLKSQIIDIAFFPVDPRLGENFDMGLRFLMETARVKHVFPMHFGNHTSVCKQLINSNISSKESIMQITGRGQVFDLTV